MSEPDDLLAQMRRAAAAQAAVNEAGAGSDPMGAIAESRTPGTPLYGILGWRSDSIMLARLRPVFMDLLADSLERVSCDLIDYRDDPVEVSCRVHPDLTRSEWCAPCVLHDLADRVQRVTSP